MLPHILVALHEIVDRFRLWKRVVLLALFRKHRAYLKIALVMKENEILKRTVEIQGRQVRFTDRDRRFYLNVLERHPRLAGMIRLVKPETVLTAWR